MKPGIDAYRVEMGKSKDEGAIVNARAEMSFAKTIEMICESIPGIVIQLMALLEKGGDRVGGARAVPCVLEFHDRAHLY